MNRIKSSPFFGGSNHAPKDQQVTSNSQPNPIRVANTAGVMNRSSSSASKSILNIMRKPSLQPQTKRVEIQEEDTLDIFSENYAPPPEQNVIPSNGHKKTSSVASFDLDNTGHYRKGGGVLASRRDIGMNDEEFAAGCKLLLAAARGDIDMVRRLLSTNNKITVDFRDYDRRTALHVAASEGHLPMVKYLVEELKCTISRSDRWGGSPLDDAHRHRHAEIVQYLRSRGAIPGTTDMTVALITAAADGGKLFINQ